MIRQHSRFLLDEQPIRWNERVWLSWHADDGFMLEKYSEQDEDLLLQPPEEVGETDEDSAPRAGSAGGGGARAAAP